MVARGRLHFSGNGQERLSVTLPPSLLSYVEGGLVVFGAGETAKMTPGEGEGVGGEGGGIFVRVYGGGGCGKVWGLARGLRYRGESWEMACQKGTGRAIGGI